MSDSNNNNSDSYMCDEPDNSGSHPKHKRKKKKEIKFIPYSEDNSGSSSEKDETEDIYKRQPDEDDHCQLKVLVEETRKKFGSGWLLHNVSPSFLPTSDVNKVPQVSSSLDDNGISISVPSPAENSSSSSLNHTSKSQPEFLRSPSVTTPGIYTNFSAFSPPLTESESETEQGDESEIFFAHHYLNDKPLMLSLGSVYFVENDGMSGKKIHRWYLSSILSAELVQEEDQASMILKFNSLILDKQERRYKMESLNSAKMLLRLLEPQIGANTHKNATEGALQCVKCQSEFSKSLVENVLLQSTTETAEGEVSQELKKIRKCPNCGSTVLLEIYQKPVATANVIYSKDMTVSMDKRNNTGNSDQSPTMRPRSVSLVNRLNDQMISKTQGPQQEENDSTSSSSIECIIPTMDDGFEKSTVRSQSDITVLSNPSQSSFTVISQSCSSVSNSSNQDMTQERAFGKRFDNSDTSRFLSSPVDIAQRCVSQDSPWYDSSSTKTTLLQSPSPRAWDLSELNSSIVSCSPVLGEHNLSSRESQKIWQMLEQKEDLVQNPVRINHQVKLHVEVNVFDNDEEFVAGINGGIVLDSTNHEIPGVLIVSTENIYIFRGDTVNLNDDSTAFEGLENYSLRSLTNVYTLLGSQGFGLSFSSNSTVLVILKDADICNSFVISLESNLKNVLGKMNLGSVPKFQLLTEEILLNVRREIFNASSEPESELDQNVGLFLLGSVQRSSDSKKTLDSVAFVVTCQCLYLAKVIYFAQPHNPALHFQLIESQEIGNLTEVHLSEEMTKASLHFLDEDVGEEEYWLFKTDSKCSLSSLLVTLKAPWEELFGIDLELTINKECICGL